MKRHVSLLVALVLVVVGLPSTAYAGVSSGTTREFIGPSNTGGGTNGWATWKASEQDVTVEASSFGTAWGRCVSSYFDWTTSDGDHYDARAARNCLNNYSRAGRISVDYSVVRGVKKMAACYGDYDEVGSCNNYSGADIAVNSGTINPNYPNYTTRMWIRFSDGSVAMFTGGNFRSAVS